MQLGEGIRVHQLLDPYFGNDPWRLILLIQSRQHTTQERNRSLGLGSLHTPSILA